MATELNRDEDLARAIRQRDITSVVRMMFAANPPTIRTGYRTETELWDFKRDCPHIGANKSELAWAEISKDVLGFHNQRGGLLIFGIADDFGFSGATQRLDSKLINDQIRRFLGDRIWVEFHREFIQQDQRYLGIALVPPRGSFIERFKIDAPDLNGKLFEKGDTAIREGDSTRVLRKEDANTLSRTLSIPTLGKMYEVDEAFFRILSPDYERFVERTEPGGELESALSDPRAAIASIVGIGGVGKTSLATWAALKAYEQARFAFIVSVTAKDRELTTAGIQALKPALTSFETLLDNILEVLKFPEYKSEPIEQKEKQVRSIIENSNGLLYVDNLETVDDKRIISFLDSLPVGVRAITTSRRAQVRVSVHPVDLGPLTQEEVVSLIRALANLPGLGYVSDLSPSECVKIGEACDRIALAIRWALVRSSTPGEALSEAESITSSGRRGEQLLEFCFRRVFDALPGAEKEILHVLSLFQRPIALEAVLVGSSLPHYKIMDAADMLVEDALAQRLFDPGLNDYTYTLLPITRAFVYSEVSQKPALERGIRNRLSDYFEAKDVRDSDERLVVREIRQGKEASESALVDLAIAAERRRDFDTASHLYEQALRRNPTSWKAARLFAEFQRHQLGNQAAALRLYEQAAANSPRRGPDRALIFREWGMLLKDSGQSEATDLAIEKFEVALLETPNDVVTIHALAHMLDRKGSYTRVIKLLEPLRDHTNSKTRRLTMPLLLNAYERAGDIVNASIIRARIREAEE